MLTDHQAVRPEHISLEALDGLKVEASVSGVETNGAETYLHADVSVNGADTREWVVKLQGMEAIVPGDQRTLYIRPEDVMAFTGEML